MACFADIYVSQGSVATYARGGWILDNFSEFFLNRWIFGKVTNKSVFNYKLCKSLSSTSSFAVLLSTLTWSSRRSLSCSTELAVVGGWREPWQGLDVDTETSSRPTSRPTAFRSASSGVFDSGEECSDSDDRSDRQSTPGTEVKVRGGVGVKRSRARSGNTGRSGDDDDDALRLAYLTTNLPSNLPVKNRFRFDRIVAMGLWLTFWPTVYIRYVVATSYSALHRESKKQDIKLLTITSLTIIRCSKFFH